MLLYKCYQYYNINIVTFEFSAMFTVTLSLQQMSATFTNAAIIVCSVIPPVDIFTHSMTTLKKTS